MLPGGNACMVTRGQRVIGLESGDEACKVPSRCKDPSLNRGRVGVADGVSG